MFDARMRVDSIRLFVSKDTVSRHALMSLKMANEEDVFVELSENVIEDKSNPKRKENKVRTRRWTDEETDILIDMFEESACPWDVFSKDYHMKDKRDKAYEKIQEELDITDYRDKKKIIGLRSQLSREVLLCFWRLVLVLIKHVLRCFMPFGHSVKHRHVLT